MPTNRRARRKSITGNITDVQKRLRFLETRPAPTKLASKAVATKNIALRAVETELIADASITTRTVGQAQITNFTLSSVTDPNGPAVDTQNIAPLAVENAQLAGNISDNKLIGMSSSKLIGQVQDSQIAGISTTKLTGTITNGQLAGSISEDKIVSLPTTKLTGTITNSQLDGSITNDKISTVDASKMTTGVLDDERIPSLAASKITSGTLEDARIPSLAASKITSGEFPQARIPNLDAAKITSGTTFTSVVPTLSPTKITGLSNVFNTSTVSGIGISRTQTTNGSYRALNISIDTGGLSNQLAVGNHTHNTLPSHNHGTLLFLSQFLNPDQAPHGHGLLGTGFGVHGHTWPAPITFGSMGTGTATSTIRFKKDVSNYKLNDPKNILNLKMKRYKYKNSKRGYHDSTNREWMYGYIAEDLQELGVEEVLSYDKDGLPDGIDYGAFSMLVLELAKVRQIEIDSIKEEIKRLKEMV
jgi:hypothetical protein